MTKGWIPKMPERTPKKGEKYLHYKGDKYEVVGLAIHSNDDIWMVVYKPLYQNADAELFTRPLDEWFSIVKFNDKLVERFVLEK